MFINTLDGDLWRSPVPLKISILWAYILTVISKRIGRALNKSDFTGTESLDMLKVFVRFCYADLLHKLRTLGIFV